MQLKKTILIVEDTDLNIDLLTQVLEADYNLLVAKDGLEAVGLALQEKPDLILMDISLPILDGYEATRRIRAALVSIPIIGLSAHAMSGDSERAKAAGCNDYLTKPIDEDRLLEKIREYFEGGRNPDQMCLGLTNAEHTRKEAQGMTMMSLHLYIYAKEFTRACLAC